MENIGTKSLKVYVCGPYTAETEAGRERNVRMAINVGIILYMKGHYPLIPHLTHYVALEAAGRHPPLEWSDYMRSDLSWLSAAEAMFFIGHSVGADIEWKEATKLGMKIFYTFDDVPFIPITERKVVSSDNNSHP